MNLATRQIITFVLILFLNVVGFFAVISLIITSFCAGGGAPSAMHSFVSTLYAESCRACFWRPSVDCRAQLPRHHGLPGERRAGAAESRRACFGRPSGNCRAELPRKLAEEEAPAPLTLAKSMFVCSCSCAESWSGLVPPHRGLCRGPFPSEGP